MTEKIFDVDGKNFEDEVLRSEQAVMIDFWAPWCTQCKALEPLISQFAEKYAGQMRFAKCNLAENTDIAVKYGIRSVPFLLFIKKGEVAEQLHGMVSKPQLEKVFQKLTDT
ncbi:MAG: thioredoxin [Desulfococcaceae bacterium]|nr:thioredoxin [Desulfococcaceae bacterium]